MGGNALKNTKTRRYDRQEYFLLEKEVSNKIMSVFNAKVKPITAYKNKPSFGDMDLLVCLPTPFLGNITDILKDTFNPNEIVKNSNVYSFDVKELQIDLILKTEQNLEMSSCYFAYNDLGNLMGRIAHKLGFKYGDDGLSVIVKDGDYQIGEHFLSKDPKAIFSFLGYDHDRFLQGFNDLEDIYQFVASSPYFNKDIYLLDNRNHVSRVRDAKRKTYTNFLLWLENPELQLPAYPWEIMGEHGGRKQIKPEVLARAESFFPGTIDAVNQLLYQREIVIASHAKWNGNLVSERTGLTGKELGGLIQKVKQYLRLKNSDIHQLILDTPDHELIELEKKFLEEINLESKNSMNYC